MKLILITGVSSGFGKSCFDYFSANNIRLVCFSRKFLNYQELLAKKFELITLIHQDLTNIPLLRENLNCLQYMFSSVIEEVIFISNAGVVEPMMKAGAYDAKNLINANSVNYIAPVLMANKLLEFSQQVHFNLKLINVSSGAASRAIEGWSVYCSQKAAMKMFYECIELENKKNEHVSIYNFNPGVMDTQMQDIIRNVNANNFPDVERYIQLKEQNQLTSPDEVVKRLVDECDIQI